MEEWPTNHSLSRHPIQNVTVARPSGEDAVFKRNLRRAAARYQGTHREDER
jgi:hypothetical protein